MTDRRALWFNGRVAHVSLKGQLRAQSFVEGRLQSVRVPCTPILTAPGGGRARELLMGQGFRVLDRQAAFAFGFAEHDGYTGYVAARDLGDRSKPPTHRVSAIRTYMKATSDLKAFEPVTHLSFGSALTVTGQDGDWARVALGSDTDDAAYVPARHLQPVGARFGDPVAVARLFRGTPYLWGGNSAFGIDCSGLVQAALLACGIACPGDSDQQAALGAEATGYVPGDLLFWPGHVAMVASGSTIIHANAHHMAVVEEPVEPALARIAASTTGPLTSHRRLA